QSSLDDNYAVFGIVTEGIDILRSIASVNTTTKNMMQNWPVEDVIINSIRIRI
ncbi:cyclophilin, partial [Thermoplasmatales archaeon ex4572_165]